MTGSPLEVVCAEKDLLVYITDNLTRNKQVNVQCVRPAGSWDMYGETLDSWKVLRLDAQYSLP